MACYWIVGGEYQATDFAHMAPGSEEQRYGPFNSYVEANKAWAQLSWTNVDNCHVRYFIVKQETAGDGYRPQPVPA